MNDERLLLEWLLSAEDIEFVIDRSRGTENRLKYAIQICCLKQTGRFIDEWPAISVNILNHLSKQLEIDLVHGCLDTGNKNSESKIRQEVKLFLEFKDFDFKNDTLILNFLEQNPLLISNKNEIAKEVENSLIKAKIHLPCKNQLMRHVYSKYDKTQVNILETFATSINEVQHLSLKRIYERNILLPGIKKPIGEVNIKNITLKIEVIEELLKLNLESLPWKLIHPSYSEKLAQIIHKYDIAAIRRIKPSTKRDVMMVCYLHESTKSIIDAMVGSYDKLIGEIERRVNRDYEIELKQLRNRARDSSQRAISTLKLLRDHKNRSIVTLEQFCEELTDTNNNLDDIISDCEKVEDFEVYGKSELAQRRYGYLTKFLQRFFDLKFKSATGSEDLMTGLNAYRHYHKEQKFTKELPTGFIENPWKKGLYKKSGELNRKAWEIGLCFAVKKGLRTGNLYLPQSKYYRDFWDPLYSTRQWKQEKAIHYKEMNVPQRGSDIIARLKQEFSEQLYMATKSFGHGNFAEIRNNRLVIHRDDPLPESAKVKELKGILDSYIEPIRIEDLLFHVQKQTGYGRAFKPIEGNKTRDVILPNILNAAITGHATNLGLYGISRNCTGISGDKLSYVSNYYINSANLKNASDILIAAQQNYWLTKIIGLGERSSSDGMRFRTSHKGLYSSMHPRYFGALDRGITIYTHMSDQCSVFNTEILSCAVREAVYVLDGLLDNQNISRPFEHSTDTAGFTEVLFALCYLLGISFQPHFKDLKDQQLYCFDRKATSYPELFSKEKIDEALICEQWDDIIRLVCSLKMGLVKPHIIVKKLHAQETFTKLAKALVHLGRIVKSTYILRYLHDEKLRYAVRQQLNRGESRHALARYVFFADQGSFKTNDYEEMMNKASCLSFVSNAMVLWNTEQMQKVYEMLNQKGFKVDEEDMARVLPLSTKNTLVHGQYSF
jgi:TnpA family transposase